MSKSKQGTIYLLHFTDENGNAVKFSAKAGCPQAGASHYLGWTTDLESRLEAHSRGHGARLMAVIREAGLTFRLARTWEGDRHLERKLKSGGHSRRCPLCRQELRRPGRQSVQQGKEGK